MPVGRTDTITGGAVGDELTGNGGDNTFVYTTLTDSLVTGNSAAITNADAITDFVAANDSLDVSAAVVTAVTAAGVLTDTEAWNTDWDTTMAAAFADANGGTGLLANEALLVTVTGTTNAGTWLAINNGTAGWSATADAVIGIDITGTLTAANFV